MQTATASARPTYSSEQGPNVTYNRDASTMQTVLAQSIEDIRASIRLLNHSLASVREGASGSDSAAASKVQIHVANFSDLLSIVESGLLATGLGPEPGTTRYTGGSRLESASAKIWLEEDTKELKRRVETETLPNGRHRWQDNDHNLRMGLDAAGHTMKNKPAYAALLELLRRLGLMEYGNSQRDSTQLAFLTWSGRTELGVILATLLHDLKDIACWQSHVAVAGKKSGFPSNIPEELLGALRTAIAEGALDALDKGRGIVATLSRKGEGKDTWSEYEDRTSEAQSTSRTSRLLSLLSRGSQKGPTHHVTRNQRLSWGPSSRSKSHVTTPESIEHKRGPAEESAYYQDEINRFDRSIRYISAISELPRAIQFGLSIYREDAIKMHDKLRASVNKGGYGHREWSDVDLQIWWHELTKSDVLRRGLRRIDWKTAQHDTEFDNALRKEEGDTLDHWLISLASKKKRLVSKRQKLASKRLKANRKK